MKFVEEMRNFIYCRAAESLGTLQYNYWQKLTSRASLIGIPTAAMCVKRMKEEVYLTGEDIGFFLVNNMQTVRWGLHVTHVSAVSALPS